MIDRDIRLKLTLLTGNYIYISSDCKSTYFFITKLLQKREMRKDIVIELSYKGFSRASDYS